MQKSRQRRDEAIERLHELAAKMLIGSLSETYRTCGQPSCRCHSTGPKHGPHLYVSYRGENGRTTGYYVPKAFHPMVREGVSAWKQLQALAKEIAHLNQELMAADRAATRRPRGKRK